MTDPKEILDDLLRLEALGHWHGGLPPEWAQQKARQFGTFAGSPSALLWGYREAAIGLRERVAVLEAIQKGAPA